MQANKRRDTAPEKALRSALHRAGARFRVDYPIRLQGRRPTRPDVVFTRKRIAVFLDGCFWHGCPLHGSRPATNQEYWERKLESNHTRDVQTTEALQAAGWTVLRFWEHDDVDVATTAVLAAVDEARAPERRRL